MRRWIKRLERDGREEMIEIAQRDGTTARFPQSAAAEAFVNLTERMGAGEDAPPEHPLIAAARNSSKPEWSNSFYAVNSEAWKDTIEDLSG